MDKLALRLGIVALFFGAILLGWSVSPVNPLDQASLDEMSAGKWVTLAVAAGAIVTSVVLGVREFRNGTENKGS